MSEMQQLATRQHVHSRNKPVTPINLPELSCYLSGYLHASYLISSFQTGFRLGYNGPRHSSIAKNLQSCKQHPDITLQKLELEVQAGRIKGPFSSAPLPNLHISPIGLVPKKTPNQFRLIHHLSYPEGTSVNDFIDPENSKVHYATFDDAVQLLLSLGQGSFMAKTDIDNAFRLIPIHPLDHNLLGIQFQDKYYFDTCLPMGASSSCAIFEKFSTALQWIATHKRGISYITHILDDFLILGPPNSSKCQEDLGNFLLLCKDIGVPIKQEKTENACQVITFMGLELDSINMVARLPVEKLNKLRVLLTQYAKARKIKLKDLQSLLGLLNFCCSVVVPGRAFLRRLIDLTKKVTRPSHRITLNKDSRKDIQAWLLFVEHFNGKSILLQHKWLTDKALHLYTDASGNLGFGAMFQTRWFFGSWPRELKDHHITFKELLPIVMALEVWGLELSNKCIVIHSDNNAVVHIINIQSSKDPHIMILVRRLVLTCMQRNILVKSVHIPGKSNILPDLLSRLQIDKFRNMAPHMERHPTAIPDISWTYH